MLLVFLMLAAMLVAGPLEAQDAVKSSAAASAAGKPEAQGQEPPAVTKPGQGKQGQGSSTPDSPADLPVSLDHIREALRKAPDQPLFRTIEIPADFRVHILEQQRLDELMSKLDFKSPPAPGGGLYGYEQQRRLFNPTERPLMQPYAAYSASEFFTVAVENLIGKYLGGRLANALSGDRRERTDRGAREEVERAILEYCASRPDRASIALCSAATER